MINSKIVHIGDTAYQVEREVRPWLGKAIDHYGAKKITEELGYDKILRGKNGIFLLVYEIKDADVIEYVEETEENIHESDESKEEVQT